MLRVFIENIYIYFARALESSGWLDNSIAIKLNKINTIKKKTKEKKNTKSISTFDFTTLYTTGPHKILIKVLSEVINFVFNPKWHRLFKYISLINV